MKKICKMVIMEWYDQENVRNDPNLVFSRQLEAYENIYKILKNTWNDLKIDTTLP